MVRRVINDRRLRLWVAATYALLPVLLGRHQPGPALPQRRRDRAAAADQAVRALVLRRVRTPEAWRGGWGAGVVLVALLAFEPSLIIPAVLIGLRRRGHAAAYAAQDRPDRHRPRAAAAGAAAVVAEHDRRSRAGSSSGPTRHSAALRPPRPSGACCSAADSGPGLPPLWLGAVVFGVIWVLVALIGLARRPDRRAVVAAWVDRAGRLWPWRSCCPGWWSRCRRSAPRCGPGSAAYLLIAFARPDRSAAGIGVDGLLGRARRGAASAGCSRSRCWPRSRSAWSAWAARSGGCWPARSGPIERTRLDAIPPYVLNGDADPDTSPGCWPSTCPTGTARYSVLADGHLRLGRRGPRAAPSAAR